MGQSTKTLRDSPLRGWANVRAVIGGRDHRWRARRPVLKIDPCDCLNRGEALSGHAACSYMIESGSPRIGTIQTFRWNLCAIWHPARHCRQTQSRSERRPQICRNDAGAQALCLRGICHCAGGVCKVFRKPDAKMAAGTEGSGPTAAVMPDVGARQRSCRLDAGARSRLAPHLSIRGQRTPRWPSIVVSVGLCQRGV